MEWNELRHIRRLSLKSKWTLTFQNVNIDNLAGNNATKNKNKEEEEVKKPRDLTGSDSVIPSQNRTEQKGINMQIRNADMQMRCALFGVQSFGCCYDERPEPPQLAEGTVSSEIWAARYALEISIPK